VVGLGDGQQHHVVARTLGRVAERAEWSRVNRVDDDVGRVHWEHDRDATIAPGRQVAALASTRKPCSAMIRRSRSFVGRLSGTWAARIGGTPARTPADLPPVMPGRDSVDIVTSFGSQAGGLPSLA
jgi:hypothetical protein